MSNLVICSGGPSLRTTFRQYYYTTTISVNLAANIVVSDYIVAGDHATYDLLDLVPALGYCAPAKVLPHLPRRWPQMNVTWESLDLPYDLPSHPIECNPSMVAAIALALRLAEPNTTVDIHGADMTIDNSPEQNRGAERWMWELDRMVRVASRRPDVQFRRVLPHGVISDVHHDRFPVFYGEISPIDLF